MPGLEDLYREIILDHYRTPRNRGELESPPAVESNGHNPLCGDEITVYLLVDGEGDDAVVSDIKIGGQGCSISQSSASMMSIDTGDDDNGAADEVALGDLEALQGVVKFPVRIKCAVLGWNTLNQALDEAATH